MLLEISVTHEISEHNIQDDQIRTLKDFDFFLKLFKSSDKDIFLTGKVSLGVSNLFSISLSFF